MNQDFPNEWFFDVESDHKLTMHRVKEHVFAGATDHQGVKIIETYDLGKILILDNQLQSAAADEYIYHECLVHPAMILADRLRKVLILGGGEGATLREVVKYPAVEEITMLDIDQKLIEICGRHLPEWHGGAYGDPRVTLIFADALDFVRNAAARFDLVLMDINDPVPWGPAARIYTREFFQSVKGLLTANGIFATQASAIFYHQSDLHSVLHQTLAAVFNRVESYGDFIPSFEAMWGFLLGSDQLQASKLSSQEIDGRIKSRLSSPLKYYDGHTHQRLFSLPKMVRETIMKQTRISTLDNPLSVFI
ncbi:MAG TPA: polyamine aminopropyltransferase [Desulfobaccales bacterium]